MPELPDAAGYRRLIARTLHHLREVELVDPRVVRNADPDEFHHAVTDQDVRVVDRRGKWLVIGLERSAIVIHLGMTGSLVGTAPPEPIAPHDRAILHGDGQIRLRDRRRLAGIWLAADDAATHDIVGPLGPDAAHITRAQLHDALDRRRAAVKTVLMDQAAVAGLGNTLSDEVLWRARLDPHTNADSLSPRQLARLHAALGLYVRRAARAGTIPRTPSWLTSQRGVPHPACPRCHHRLERTRLNGRTALWCPQCQRDGADDA